MSFDVTKYLPESVNIKTETMVNWYKKAVDSCFETMDNCTSEQFKASGLLTNDINGKCFEISKQTCIPEGDQEMKSIFSNVFESCFASNLKQVGKTIKSCVELFKDRSIWYYRQRNICHNHFENDGNQELLLKCIKEAENNFEEELDRHLANQKFQNMFPKVEIIENLYQKAIDACFLPCDQQKLIAPSNMPAKGIGNDFIKHTCVPENNYTIRSIFLKVFDTCHLSEPTTTAESFKACTEFLKENVSIFYIERRLCHFDYFLGPNNKGNQEALQTCVAAAQKTFEENLKSSSQLFEKSVLSKSKFQESTLDMNSLFKNTVLGLVVIASIAVSIGIIKKSWNHFSNKKKIDNKHFEK